MELVDLSRQRLAASRAGYLCRAQEPSRLGEVLVVVADLPSQVGFASLERKLEVSLGQLPGWCGPWGSCWEFPGFVVAGSGAGLRAGRW